ncbi:MAG TPA: hypothetical protein VF221_06520 [Chloroflexota bacterium]
MIKTWTGSSQDVETLARDLEAHLNEFADEVLSVSYAVSDGHHALAVYKLVEPRDRAQVDMAVTTAEHIIEHSQP